MTTPGPAKAPGKPERRSPGRWALGVFVLALLALVSVTGRAPRAQSSLNLVYVESNIGSTSDNNSVFGFSNDGSGNLTALPGSPYLTDGTGVYVGGGSVAFDADQEVVISPDGNLLFAVNGDSNTVAVFNINSDGTLTAVSGSPFASGGHDPASIGLAWQALSGGQSAVVVANKNDDPNQDNSNTVPNYTNFTTNSSGVLTPIESGGTISLASGASPSQALVPTTTRHLVIGMEFGTSRIVSYALRGNGSMTQVSTISPPPGGSQFLGEWYSPKSVILYAGIPLPGPDLLAVYTFSASGAMSFVRTVANNGEALCWLRTNKEGTRLYTAETISGTITTYDITNPMNPTMKQQVTLSGGGGSNIALDPTGQFLYALAGTELHVLNVLSDGTLSETLTPVTLNVPSGEHPLGLAVAMK